jgi:NAD(P)-dependent dehydrogenase (short-subunit alcohol dehydrogenase family)
MGLATAELLASRGAIISLADINEETLEKACKTLLPGSSNHIYTVVDVRITESVNAWIEKTVRELGKIDCAVNMAGIIVPATPITEHSDEDWDNVFAVNTRGVFNCLRAQLRAMTSGSIVRVSPPHNTASLGDD